VLTFPQGILDPLELLGEGGLFKNVLWACFLFHSNVGHDIKSKSKEHHTNNPAKESQNNVNKVRLMVFYG